MGFTKYLSKEMKVYKFLFDGTFLYHCQNWRVNSLWTIVIVKNSRRAMTASVHFQMFIRVKLQSHYCLNANNIFFLKVKRKIQICTRNSMINQQHNSMNFVHTNH